MFSMRQLELHLIEDEAKRTKPYLDTKGKWTIGIGHNLTDNGLSLHIIEEIFTEDVADKLAGLDRYLPWWRKLDDVRQIVIIDMAFNMGVEDLLKFKHFLAALEAGDYAAAASEMENSAWWHEVGQRAVRLKAMMLTGIDPLALRPSA